MNMSKAAKRLFTGTLLAMLLLSGCGTQAKEETIPAATADSGADTAEILTGKISSISGNEITLFKAVDGGIQDSAVASPASAGEQNTGDGDVQASGTSLSGNGAADTATGGAIEESGAAATDSGDSAGNGSSGSGTVTDKAGSGQTTAPEAVPGTGDGSDLAALKFSDETVTITFDDDTQFTGTITAGIPASANTEVTGKHSGAEEAISTDTEEAGTSYSDGSIAGSLSLADLKAGDIIRVTLKPETLTASVIELQTAVVTGGGNMGTEPSPGTSPSPQPTPGADGQPQQNSGAVPGDGGSAPPQGGKPGDAPAGGKGGGTPPSGAPGGAQGGAPGKGGAAGSGGTAAQPAASAKPAASGKPAAGSTAAAGSAGASAKPAESAKPATSSKPAAGSTAAAGDAAKGGNPGGTMSFGKIKSSSGSTITIYTAEAQAAPAQGGAAPEGGAGGTPPSSRPDGEAGAGGGETPGSRPQGGGGQMSFSEETAVITVTSSTKLLTVTFADGKRTEAAITLAGLKAGDVIQYSLKSGTTQAESISLSSGTPGGGQ